MPRKPPSAGFSNPFNERQPLLKSRTTDTCINLRSDLEAAALAEPADPQKPWRFLWYLFLNILLTVGALVPILTATNNEEGVGSDNVSLGPSSSLMLPQFDTKWAWWRALGGGLSGAAGTSIPCICQLETTHPF